MTADLPAPPAAAAPPAGGDAVVAALLPIWQEVLQIEEVAPDDDLFDLGGDSVSIMMIGSRIHRELGVEIPLDTFFDTPTVAEIAELIQASQTTAPAPAGGTHPLAGAGG